MTIEIDTPEISLIKSLDQIKALKEAGHKVHFFLFGQNAMGSQLQPSDIDNRKIVNDELQIRGFDQSEITDLRKKDNHLTAESTHVAFFRDKNTLLHCQAGLFGPPIQIGAIREWLIRWSLSRKLGLSL